MMSTDRPHRPEPPSDLELMLYFDGELEEPRRAEVAAFVGADLRARSKVAGLRIAAALVQNEPRPLAAADDIADLVMARIAANGAQDPAVTPAHDPAALPLQPAPSLVAAPVVSPAPRLAPQPIHAPARPAANDNGRRMLVGLVALVAAAAAAFAVWGRGPSGPAASTIPATQSPVAALSTPHSTAVKPAPLTPPSTEPEIDAAAVAPEADGDHGVEVAAVNFGAHMGSIFYVPSGSIEAKRTTTVVWLADDAGE